MKESFIHSQVVHILIIGPFKSTSSFGVLNYITSE